MALNTDDSALPNADYASPLHAALDRAIQGAKGFAADMREQGIHVGMGSPPRCVTCGEDWPCTTEHNGSYGAAEQ